MLRVGIISCDIVAHCATKDPNVQRRRLEGLNAIVRASLARCKPEGMVWYTGGDGGHAVFRGDDWPADAAHYMIDLVDWTKRERLELRVTGHCGDVDQIEDVDGRAQFIGDGLNLAGRLLALAFPDGVLVSEPFKSAIEQAGVDGARMHDPRVIRPLHFAPQIVYLLSISGRFTSKWDRPSGGNRDLLAQAINSGQAWQVLLFAKRLFQANSFDDRAEEALDQVGSHSLVFRQQTLDADGVAHQRLVPNSFLAGLESDELRQVVRAAQLVERRRGEVLCQAGDEGDTMFVVLDGTIGAFIPESPSGTIGIAPDLAFGPGEIVGELAFALRRPRTAALLALDDTSLLGVHAEELAAHARSNPGLFASVDRFLTGRTVAFVCDAIPYLGGRDHSGPLGEVGRKGAWDRLLPHAEKIVCALADPRPLSLTDPRFAGDGIYVLVSGRLRSLAHPDKVLSGADLPLVYADLTGWACSPDHAYRPEEGDAILLRLSMKAFLGRRPVIDALLVRIMPELSRLFHYDAFLSYTFDDQPIALGWRDSLEAAGLRVYMEVSASGRYFRDRIEAGILDSLAMVVLVSINTMVRPLDQNWVRREIAFRKAAFETTTARLLPVRLKGGQPELLADGYTIIESVDREDAALADVIIAIRRIRQGADPVPFSRSRKTDIHLV